uniref:Uncharacterized protein n=1 Tax=Streptomyces sp. NBC_00049 TaxID=2903617 RepID=A0AAU2JS55_9ACTN
MHRKVAERPWALAVVSAVAAAVTSVPMAVAARDDAVFMIACLVPAALIAVPLLLRRRPKAFAVVCLVMGAVVLPVGALGALMGLFALLLAPPLLIVAAFAHGPDSPGLGWVSVAFVTSVLVNAGLLAQ